MSETNWNTGLEVSIQKGDKKMPMGKYGYSGSEKPKKKKKKMNYPCVGCDEPNSGKPKKG